MLVLVFFALLRPPFRATLFPYTTLFRSEGVPEIFGRPNFLASLRDAKIIKSLTRGLRYAATSGYHLASLRLAEKCANSDRKSTRLNSSHRCISYAVFCLKKKKTMYMTTQ